MVDSGRKPAVWGMAGGTVGAELTIVFVIFGVTGIAILGSAQENMVDMTILAGHADMFSSELKC